MKRIILAPGRVKGEKSPSILIDYNVRHFSASNTIAAMVDKNDLDLFPTSIICTLFQKQLSKSACLNTFLNSSKSALL